jgi:hypothetical protein
VARYLPRRNPTVTDQSSIDSLNRLAPEVDCAPVST